MLILVLIVMEYFNSVALKRSKVWKCFKGPVRFKDSENYVFCQMQSLVSWLTPEKLDHSIISNWINKLFWREQKESNEKFAWFLGDLFIFIYLFYSWHFHVLEPSILAENLTTDSVTSPNIFLDVIGLPWTSK